MGGGHIVRAHGRGPHCPLARHRAHGRGPHCPLARHRAHGRGPHCPLARHRAHGRGHTVHWLGTGHMGGGHTVYWLGTGHMGGGEFRVMDSEAVLYANITHTVLAPLYRATVVSCVDTLPPYLVAILRARAQSPPPAG